MKKLSLVVLIACAFLVGYATVVEAWPVYGRAKWHGYFLNRLDDDGDAVWNEGIPNNIDTADEFITYTKARLNDSNRQKSTGAAFIIQTMIGNSRLRSPSSSQVAEWEGRVRYAESQGWIDWSDTYTYTLNSYYQGGRTGTNPDDDAFFEEESTQTGLGITFKGAGGTIKYQLKRSCANPTGIVSPIDDQPNYTITGRSTVSANVVFRGDTVTFKHYLRNIGTSNSTINWKSRNGITNADISSGSYYIAMNREVEVNNESFVVPGNAADGTRYCRYVYFSPAQNGTGSGAGASVCATVSVPLSASFSIDPQVSASSSVAQQDDSVTFTYRLQISGSPTSTNINCKAVGGDHIPGYSPLPRQAVDRNPAINLSPALECGTNLPAAPALQTIGTETISVGGLASGSRICRSLTVSPRDQNGGAMSSAETCVVIAKTPLSHFMGNDVWAGGGFESANPSCTGSSKISAAAHGMSDGTIAGSGVEYAAFALGSITDFGSLNKAMGIGNIGKVMTFANIDANLGNFGAPKHCIDDYMDNYSTAALLEVDGDLNVASQASGAWKVSGNRNVYGDMPVGAQQVYVVEGDVVITGNIRYPGNYDDASKIPSLVLISTGKITVDSSVTDISGLFVAKHSFDTCNPPVGITPSISNCNTQLTINGAVKAGKLNLLRNFGADGASVSARKQPAEIFKFNPEMYIQSALSSSDVRTLKTIDQKDLPPRF